ncbi:hypothetical protein [Rhodococcus rhodochrous]|uniref:hypothetical protein n=1 Tax=Rhodococcus rhodochrous TaxID=1829 RepID=UPI0012FD5B46|nr:hypothetical protein [Rhodococcus rhodochrous]
MPRISQEVTDRMVSDFIPEMGKEIDRILGHPDAPGDIYVTDLPEMDGRQGVSVPTPTDSTPPAQNLNFDAVPDIPVTPDRTGGIDLSRADPIDSIPHKAPEYKPVPGKETGGFKPEVKPADKPVPNTNDPPPLQGEPKPETSTSSPPEPGTTIPGTGTGTPVPEKTTSPPPQPELKFPF